MGKRLGVIGWPVAHSLSPAFQNAALKAAGLTEWRYQRLPIPPERFVETVRALPAAGFRGVNITIPHKETALALADDPSPRALAIGAANTLLFEPDGRIRADNTDAPGLIGALPIDARGLSVLVLGAGGTARAAVWALLNAGASEVRVWNRNPERARRLCSELGGTPVERADAADLLVHTTPIGLDGNDKTLKGLPLGADDLLRYKILVDFVYRGEGTALVRAARNCSIETVDGLELLIAQGALSFQQFTGIAPSVAAMREAVGLP
jgi:shikimate dehydrogenase